jgi:rhodanese-related sulfurtransferase
VREPAEFTFGHVKGAVNIPLGELRERMNELPQNKEILTYCAVGQRSYYASRALRLNKFNARNISGGMKTYIAQSNDKK